MTAAGTRANGADYDDGLVAELNEEYAVALAGDKVLVLKEEMIGGRKEGFRFLTVEAFCQFMSNQRLLRNGGLVEVSKIWLKHPDRRTYRDIVFKPGQDTDADGVFNLWRGFSVAPAPGDCGLYKQHLLTNICGNNGALFRWLWGWLAHLVQRPGEKPNTALVLRGGQGVGKTFVGEKIGELFAPHYVLVDHPRYITGQFNAHIAAVLLLQADEGFWAGDKEAEGRLKSLVTSKSQMIEKKGVDPFKVENFTRLLVTSNEDWVVPAGWYERRFCVIECGEGAKQNHEYFAAIQKQMDDGGREALLYDLLHFDLSLTDIRKIPATAALSDQKTETMHADDAWWLDRLMAGEQLRGKGWAEWVACDAFHDDYQRHASALGRRRRASQTQLGIKLRKWLPHIDHRYGWVESGESFNGSPKAERRYGYIFGTLAQARAAFEAYTGQRWDWPPPDPAQGGGAATAADAAPSYGAEAPAAAGARHTDPA